MDTNGKIQLFPLLRIAIALGLGVVAGDGVGDRLPVWVWLSVLGVTLIPLCFMRFRPVTETCRLYSAIFVFGGWITVLKEKQLRIVLPDHEMEYEAIVASRPVVKGKVIRFDMLITHVAGSPCRCPLRVKATLLRDTVEGRYKRLDVGSGLMAHSVLVHPKGYVADSHFDYVRWLQVHGFVAETFIYCTQWRTTSAHLSTLSEWEQTRLSALRLRQQLADRLRQNGIEGEALSVIAAMTLGDKSGLTREMKEAYSVSGASHVLALSGLHLGIIYTFLTLLFPRRRWRVASQGVVLGSIWSYVILVGMPASVVRAAVMISVYAVASLLGRARMSVNALSLAAIVMLVANPLNLWDIGFQFSFAAVLAIFILFQPLSALLPKRLWMSSCMVKWVWSMIIVSVAAQVGTAPLVMYYFGRFACYFLLTNMIVVPAATIIVYGAVVMLLTMPVPVVGKTVAAVLIAVAGVMNRTLTLIASLPCASIEGISVSPVQVAGMYILIAAAAIFVFYFDRIKSVKRLDCFNQKD